MFNIVNAMRSGQCDMENILLRVNEDTMNHLQAIADSYSLSVDEAIACIMSDNIITHPDGTYNIKPDNFDR